MKKCICIVYSSRKGGHKFPAEALANFLARNYSAVLTVNLINILDHSKLASWLDAMWRRGDLKLPALWKKGYSHLENGNSELTNFYKKLMPILVLNPISKAKILRAIGMKADLIISFQPEVNCVFPWLEERLHTLFHTVIIDYSVHSLWINDKVNRYYVPNPEIAQKVAEFGVPLSKIRVTGIPPRTGFLEVMQKSIPEQRMELKLDPSMPTVLLLGGLLGTMVDYPKVIEAISRITIPHQLLVVFGKNGALRMVCKPIVERARHPIHTYGTVSNMHELMWAADLVVSKPGSVTIAEALVLGKPMVLMDPKAGSAQEMTFSEFVEEMGAGIRVKEVEDVGKVVNSLLASPHKLRSMAERSNELGSFNRLANRNIAQSIIETLAIQNA